MTGKRPAHITANNVIASAARLTEVRQPCLVEQYIPGRELNVSLVGFPTARVLPLSEIDFSGLPEGQPKIVSYEAKWSEGSADDLGSDVDPIAGTHDR